METAVIAPTPEPKIILAPDAGGAPKPGEKPPRDPFWDNLKADAAKAADAKPTAAPEGKTTTPASAAEEEIPAEIKSEKGRSDFKTLKADRDAAKKALADFEAKYTNETGELKTKYADMERQFAELKAKANPEEFEKLKSEREDLSLRLRLKDVTSDPQWEKNFVAPVNNAIKEAVAQVPEEQRRRAEWVLKQPDSEERTAELEGMISGLGTLKASRFANALSTIDNTRTQASALLADAPNLVKRYEESRRIHQEALMNQSKVELNRLFDAAVPKFAALPWGESPEEAAKTHQEAVQTARSYYESSDPEARARMANWAAFGEKAEARVRTLSSELAKANEVIKQLQGAKPGNGSVNPGSSNVKPDKDPFAAFIRGNNA